MTTQLAHLVRQRRGQLGLSARGLSLAAGQSASYVSKLEAGTIEPSFTAFARLVTALRFTPSEMAFAVAVEAMRTP